MVVAGRVCGVAQKSTLPALKQVMLSCTVEVDDLALRPWVLNVTHPGLPPIILGATSQASFQRWRQALTSAAAFAEDPSTCGARPKCPQGPLGRLG